MVPPAAAQAPTTPVPANVPPTFTIEEPKMFRNMLNNYRTRYIPAINLSNSSRLDSLIRAGKIYLSLQDAIALALENNLDIELSRYGPMIAEADYLRARAGGLLRGVPTAVTQGPSSVQSQVIGGSGQVSGASRGDGSSGTSTGGTVITQTGTQIPNLDPGLFASYQWGHATRPLSNTVTTGTTSVISRSSVFNFGYQQGFLSGTTVSYGWNNSGFQSNNRFSDINPGTQGSMNLQVSQTLLRGFGFAVNGRNIKIAQNDKRISDLVFEQQVITTVSAIINLYWDLVAFNEDVKVKRQALALAEKLYSDNKKQVEIGTLAPIEIVRAEAEVASRQQDLTVSETSVLQQETIIKNALSRTGTSSPSVAEARIVPTDLLRLDTADAILPLQDQIEMAMSSRPELKQTQINIDSAKIGLAGSRSQLLPQLDVQGNLQNNALVGQGNFLVPPGQRRIDPFFVGGFGSALAQIFRRNFPDYSLGFQLSVPLRNRSAQSDYIRDSLQLRQSELRQRQQINQIRVDVQNALIGVQQARSRYQAALKNRVLQEQNLDAEQKKYALGASTIFFVIQAQRDLATAQASEVSAMANYSRARVQMELVTGQTLKANNISISEAREGKVSRPPSALPPGM
jgi:outer membrane protein TolC